jgi:hypothetical protein
MKNILLLMIIPPFSMFSCRDEKGFWIFEDGFTERGFLFESWEQSKSLVESFEIEEGKLVEECLRTQNDGEVFRLCEHMSREDELISRIPTSRWCFQPLF